jgi:hypothetical protein
MENRVPAGKATPLLLKIQRQDFPYSWISFLRCVESALDNYLASFTDIYGVGVSQRLLNTLSEVRARIKAKSPQLSLRALCIQTTYFFKLSAYILRNFATLGATTNEQYPCPGLLAKYS